MVLSFFRVLTLLALASGAIAYSQCAIAADVVSTWDGATGNWGSSHWLHNPDVPFYPNNGNGGFTYDVVINSGAVTFEPTLEDDIVLEKLTFGGSTITGPTVLKVNDLFTWTGGP
jgi:hypothetical protein